MDVRVDGKQVTLTMTAAECRMLQTECGYALRDAEAARVTDGLLVRVEPPLVASLVVV